MYIYMCEYRQGKKTIYHYLNTSLLYNNQVPCSDMTAENGWYGSAPSGQFSNINQINNTFQTCCSVESGQSQQQTPNWFYPCDFLHPPTATCPHAKFEDI